MAWKIYKHTNKINGKVYIGQTCQKLNDRWQNGKGYINSKLFNNAIQKYGWDGFTHEILEDNIKTIDDANAAEAYYIKKFNSYIRLKGAHGYNMTPGGDSSGENWEAWEDEILVENYNEVGANACLLLLNDKWSNIAKGFKRTRRSIYIHAMRLNLKKKVFWNDEKDRIIKKYYPVEGRYCCERIKGATKKMCEWRASILGVSYGVYWSDNEIAILKENYKFGYTRLMNELSTKTKSQIKYKVNQLHLKEHEPFVCYETRKIYNSLANAAKETGAWGSVIKKCLIDTSRTLTSGGYHWCYKDDFENGWNPNHRPNVNSKAVYCIQTREKYDSIIIAEKQTGCSNISRCCSNHMYQCRDKNGKLLNWCFYDEKESFVFIKKKASWNAKAIECVETNEKFDSLKDVLLKYNGISKSTLFRALKDQSKKAGGYHWKYCG